MAYRKIEYLQEYVIVSQDNVKVEVYRKYEQGNWARQILRRTDAVNLNSIDLELTMTGIYENALNF